MNHNTQAWLAKFNDVQAALDEREIYHAESGMDRELDFNAEDDIVYAELSLMIENQRSRLNVPEKMGVNELPLFMNNLD